MNESKFSLADLLTVLGTLGFGFFCYLSINFYTLGDTILSISWGAGIAILLGGLAFIIKLIKCTSRNFKSSIITEWVLLFFFILFAIGALIPFSHFFYVTSKKEAIQEKVVANIEKSEGLFAAYESEAETRLNMYKALLTSVVAAKRINPRQYQTFGFVYGTSDDTQVGNKLFSLKAQLYPSNYLDMKQVNNKWLADAKQNIKDWSPLGIVAIVNTLKDDVPTWKEQLNSYSKFRAKGEAVTTTDFDFPISFDDVSGNFTEESTPTPLSLLLAIGFYLLMLLSYFIKKRHTRFPGFKAIFGSSKMKGNEL